ncbi:hypothetical protein [Myroides sp.]|uniref:hypothetical protein n=1 Tax=Myroides sp. TaxID=1874736 RepID=UPI003F30F7C3
MKKSYNQLGGIFLQKIVWFTGVGVILSMVLAINRIVPDTMEMCFLIVSPFFLANLYYFLARYCNSISFEGSQIVIKTFTGTKMLYSKKDILAVEILEHKGRFGAVAGYTLVLIMGGSKQKKWRLSGYTEKTIQEILTKIGDEPVA